MTAGLLFMEMPSGSVMGLPAHAPKELASHYPALGTHARSALILTDTRCHTAWHTGFGMLSAIHPHCEAALPYVSGVDSCIGAVHVCLKWRAGLLAVFSSAHRTTTTCVWLLD